MAYTIGRLFNELDWNTQLAFLGGSARARKRVAEILGVLTPKVRVVVPDSSRTALTQSFQESVRGFDAAVTSPRYADDFSRAAQEVDHRIMMEDGEPDAVREEACDSLLYPVREVQAGLRDQTLSLAGLTSRKAIEFGIHVDQGLRPAPAYRHMFRRPPIDFDPPASFGPPSTALPVATPTDVLVNTIPESGKLPLPVAWLDLVEQLWAELVVQVTHSTIAGRLTTGFPGNLVREDLVSGIDRLVSERLAGPAAPLKRRREYFEVADRPPTGWVRLEDATLDIRKASRSQVYRACVDKLIEAKKCPREVYLNPTSLHAFLATKKAKKSDRSDL